MGVKEAENKEKPPYKLAVLKDRKGDITKRWHIEFYIFNHELQKLERRFMYMPTELATAKARKAWGKEHVDAINEMLKKGYAIPAKKKAAPKKEKELNITEAIKAVTAAAMNELSPDSARTYKNISAAFIEFLKNEGLGSIKPSDLESSTIAKYLDAISAKGLSNMTSNAHLSMIKAIGSRMNDRGIHNTFGRGIKRKRALESRNTPFTDEQRQKLSAWFKENMPGLGMASMLLYHAFIRPAEMVKLKVSDIDCEKGIIRLSGAQTKNNKNANVPMTLPLLNAMREWVKGASPTDYVIGKGIAVAPTAIIRTRITEAHRKAMDACGIDEKELTLYTWKDTGACNAYKSGLDIKTLQNMLRHSSVAITEVYLRSLGETVLENIQGKSW